MRPAATGSGMLGRGDTRECELREAVYEAVRSFVAYRHSPRPFEAGVTYIPASGKSFDSSEVLHLVDSALDFHLTGGRYGEAFEERLRLTVGAAHSLMVNSGSSANLLALQALCQPELGAAALRSGDEVLTAAAGFPTTVNPILQNGLVPVFLDVELGTYAPTLEAVEEACGPRTKAIMLAHTLGNPFPVGGIAEFARKRGIWLIEDCCDALGARFEGRAVSSFGHLGTFSFYPAHQITTGEGGAVVTSDGRLKRLVESLRDWGRDCWCAPGRDNTCGKRFGWRLGDLPEGYDHKYTYSRAGYNLKATEMQAAIGIAQLDKLPDFVARRRRNYERLLEGLAPWRRFIDLPETTAGSEPSWFGFPVSVAEDAPFERARLVSHLEAARIGTRPLFAGDITRQPYFRDVPFRTARPLRNTARIMRDTFWTGVHPGVSDAMVDYAVSKFEEFFQRL